MGPLRWEYGVLATGPPGESLPFFLQKEAQHGLPQLSCLASLSQRPGRAGTGVGGPCDSYGPGRFHHVAAIHTPACLLTSGGSAT